MRRTHTCGQLRQEDIGKHVVLEGWCHTRRDHGGLIFIDLRDRYGLTQVVFDPQRNKEAHSVAESLRREDVIGVKGVVARRKPNMENLNLETGMIEVFVHSIAILNRAQTPPLEIDDRIVASEENRLTYRYLDLRRPIMQKLLKSRFEASMAVRNTLRDMNFIEVETPMLIKPTPEGARDYIVPSRINPGKFYALPQSPQLYKQILMIAGVDRYFQLARCLRDEDLRADRQPEHTQIDIEMSFVEREDVLDAVEKVMVAVWKTKGINLKTPFPRFSYKAVLEKYGTDKPDMRYELFLHDVSSIAAKSDFSVFKNVLAAGGIVKCICVPQDLSRNEIDPLIVFCQQHGAKGMAWMRVAENKLESNIAKFFPEAVQHELITTTGAKPGNILMFIADKPHLANLVLDKLRQELAKRLNLIKDELKFCWVTDFPFFEWNEEEQKWDAAHNPFSMIKEEDLQHLESHPEKVHCLQYDLVLNGWELGSGSIRINKPELQERVLKVLGLSKEQVQKKFGFLLEAYKYGAPIHGGIGIGFDRVVAMLNNVHDIREVIAFPKNKAAQNPMDGSPSEAEERQLKELHLKLDILKEKKGSKI
jgi:aspartyl-tRNA synthetase